MHHYVIGCIELVTSEKKQPLMCTIQSVYTPTSLSTGQTLRSPTESSSQDSSHPSHLAEGKCTCPGGSEMGTSSAWAYTGVIPHVRSV